MNKVKCDICGRTYDTRGLAIHKKKHLSGKIDAQGTCPPPEHPRGEMAKATPLPSKTVTYRSPRVRSLRVIIKPSFWTQVNTPQGSHVIKVEGKVAEFKDGRFTTDDPEIIEVLNKYSNRRFPVISEDAIREMGKCLRK
jgi:hypothetical protein